MLFLPFASLLALATAKPFVANPSATAPSSTPISQPLPQSQPEPTISVSLSHLDNTTFKATVTNEGDWDISVYRQGSILDNSPGEKVTVQSGNGTEIPYTGLTIHALKADYIITPQSVPRESLILLPSNKTVQNTFDIGNDYDLISGETYSVFAQGGLNYIHVTERDEEEFRVVRYRASSVEFRAP